MYNILFAVYIFSLATNKHLSFPYNLRYKDSANRQISGFSIFFLLCTSCNSIFLAFCASVSACTESNYLYNNNTEICDII